MLPTTSICLWPIEHYIEQIHRQTILILVFVASVHRAMHPYINMVKGCAVALLLPSPSSSSSTSKEMACIFILFYYHLLNQLSADLTSGNKINIVQTFLFEGQHKTNQNITKIYGFSEDDGLYQFLSFNSNQFMYFFRTNFDFFFFSSLPLSIQRFHSHPLPTILSHPTSTASNLLLNLISKSILEMKVHKVFS